MGKTTKIILTDRQEKWLRVHFKHTKNDEICARLGISASAMHRMARAMGLRKSPQFVRRMQADAAQKAKASHLLNGTYPPKGYRIPRSEEFGFQKGVTPEQRLGKRKNRQRIERSAASRRETYRLERARALFGIERQTKLRVVRLPKYVTNQRYRLRKLGYIVPRGGMVAYYTPETQRSAYYETRTKDNSRRYVAFTFKEKPADRATNG